MHHAPEDSAARSATPPSAQTTAAPPLTPQARERLRAIRGALETGDIARGAAAAQAALDDGLRHPFLYNAIAMRLEADGELNEAEATLREGLAIDPADAGCSHALALLLLRLERPEEAQPLLETILTARPQFAPAWVAAAQAFEATGQMAAAESRYRRALVLAPDNLLARAGLASVEVRRGNRASARQHALAVLAAEPNYPPAAMVAAEADVADGNLDEAAARMRALLAEPRVSSVERALALSVLGDALDALGRHPEAFAAYRESNEIRRTHYAPRFADHGTLEYAVALRNWFHKHGVRDLLTVMPPEVSKSPAGGHGFLIGFPRSGTTLLEQVLASHPRVKALEERETLIDSVRSFMRTPGDLARLGLTADEELAGHREAYWRRVMEAGVVVQRHVFIDKHPFNGFKLPLIARLFPEARILLAVRDPRDVLWSCYRRRFRMSAPYFELLRLETAAALYDAVMDITQMAITQLELRVHVIKLERLTADFDGEVRSACAFLDLDWTEELREFAQTARGRGVATASGAQVARGLNSAGIGAWRHYREQLAPVMPVLDRWAAHFGYP